MINDVGYASINLINVAVIPFKFRDDHLIFLERLPNLMSTIPAIQDLCSYELFAGSSVLTGEFSLALNVSQFGWGMS